MADEAGFIPGTVPHLNVVKRALSNAARKHQLAHAAHHRLALQVQQARDNMIALGQLPPNTTAPPSGAAGGEGLPPLSP